MASAYYGANRGQQYDNVVYASSTNSTDIEVRVNLANLPTKEEALIKLMEIMEYMLRDVDQIYG